MVEMARLLLKVYCFEKMDASQLTLGERLAYKLPRVKYKFSINSRVAVSNNKCTIIAIDLQKSCICLAEKNNWQERLQKSMHMFPFSARQLQIFLIRHFDGRFFLQSEIATRLNGIWH